MLGVIGVNAMNDVVTGIHARNLGELEALIFA
jgi:hypothetical protein